MPDKIPAWMEEDSWGPTLDETALSNGGLWGERESVYFWDAVPERLLMFY